MIDSNKSVIIFSHPRSGSTWFQDGFSQYNLSELFNIYLKYTINNGIHFSYCCSSKATSAFWYNFSAAERLFCACDGLYFKHENNISK